VPLRNFDSNELHLLRNLGKQDHLEKYVSKLDGIKEWIAFFFSCGQIFKFTKRNYMNIHNCSLEIDGWRDEYEGFGE
jgi:hypothetical protein